MSRFPAEAVARYEAKRAKAADDACWPWTATTVAGGYGRFTSGGKKHLAHRVAWELANGSIPEGMDVLHRCDNPPCCNPSHLFLGTDRDNALDAIAKGRAALGDRNGMVAKPSRHWSQHRRLEVITRCLGKLVPEQVSAIRRRAAAGEKRAPLAREFGISLSSLKKIMNRSTWKDVP